VRGPSATRTRRAAVMLGVGATAVAVAIPQAGATRHHTPEHARGAAGTLITATPIKHLVVIFQENVSFDHYFATYPYATNPAGEPRFVAKPATGSVNGLSGPLLTNNPNGVNPFRLDRSQAATCDMDHDYTAEQSAFDSGLMDKFLTLGCDTKNTVMGYFDGNTVTGLWNYAQHFAMSDNSYGTTFGPSTPGALNLVSGQTHGATPSELVLGTGTGAYSEATSGSVIGDPQPTFDDCTTRDNVAMSGKNIGELLNAKGISWGWFQGGFRPTAVVNGKAVCGSTHTGADGNAKGDYIPHHEPFQYYASTANPHHLPPTSIAMIGKTDQANHQYDLTDFWAAADHANLPAVSFLKAPGYLDGHAGYSSPLLEQQFLANTINHLEMLPQWSSTAVVVAWDDSDGWYDHQIGPIINPSHAPAGVASDATKVPTDTLNGGLNCGTGMALGGYQGRCGYGPRLPLLVISPYAKVNYIDHTVTDQTSILRFVEDNWLGAQRIGDGSFDAVAGDIDGMFAFGRRAKAERLWLDLSSGQPIGDDTLRLHRRVVTATVSG
jgi:phospholipase C